MQTDGNFVVYGIKSGNMTALWNAGTHVYGSGTYRLELGDDSVLKVKKNGNTVWSSPNTPINSDPYGSLGWRYVFDNSFQYSYISGGYKEDRNGSIHKGIDIIGRSMPISGVDIKSPAHGYVQYAVQNHPDAGNYIAIRTDSNIRVGFMHMLNPPLLSAEKEVLPGTIVGQVGNTGASNGAHLHLTTFTSTNWATDNNIINPQRFFPNVSFTGKTSTLP